LAITSDGSETNSVAWGKVVTLTATVKTAGTAVPQGQVNFCDVAAAYCTDSPTVTASTAISLSLQ
jgi:hypothetical protein